MIADHLGKQMFVPRTHYGMGVARKSGNFALEVPCAPKQAGRRLVFGGGNSPNQDTWQKNRSVLHMLCKYDTMARVHTHATHTGKGLSEYDCSSRQGPPRPQMYVPQMSQLGPPVHGV